MTTQRELLAFHNLVQVRNPLGGAGSSGANLLPQSLGIYRA